MAYDVERADQESIDVSSHNGTVDDAEDQLLYHEKLSNMSRQLPLFNRASIIAHFSLVLLYTLLFIWILDIQPKCAQVTCQEPVSIYCR